MADKKITQLNELFVAGADDVFAIVDLNINETMKMTRDNLMATPGPIGATTPFSGAFTTLNLSSGETVSEISSDSSASEVYQLLTASAIQQAIADKPIVTDHGELTGLLDDDHPQYALVDGTRHFTGLVTFEAGVNISGGNLELSTGTPVNEISSDSTASEVYQLLTASAIQQALVDLITASPSFDNRMARYDGTDAIQGTGITVDDSDNITGVNDLTLDGNLDITGDLTFDSGVAVNEISSDSTASEVYQLLTASAVQQAIAELPVAAPSFDNRMARYDGTDAIQGTGITVDDSDNITGVASYSIGSDNALSFPVDNTNVAVGAGAGSSLASGTNNVIIGYEASLYNETGYDNVIIGREAGQGASGQNYIHDTFLGYRAGYSVTTGGYNFYGGSQAGYFNQTGQYNVVIGESAGYGSSGNSYSNNTFVGNNSGNATTTGGDNVYMGYRSAYYNQTGTQNVVLGSWAGYGVTANSYSNSTIIGYKSSYFVTTGGSNTSIGFESTYFNETGSYNTVFGYQAGYGTSGQNYSSCSFIGYKSGFSNTTGLANIFLGRDSGYYNQTGSYNITIGFRSGYGATGQSYSNNTFVGHDTGFSTTTGGNNVFMGYEAGYSNQTGASNIFIGYQAGYSETGSNKLYIENSNSASPLIYGEFDNDLVRINGDLDITGSLTFDTTGVAVSEISNISTANAAYQLMTASAIQQAITAGGGAGAVGFEGDMYQDLLTNSIYTYMTYDDFTDQDLVDTGSSTMVYDSDNSEYDFTAGEVLQSVDLVDPALGGYTITECLVSIDYEDSGDSTSLIQLSTDSTSWETATNDDIHTFTNPGQELYIRYTGGGTGKIRSWAVLYYPDLGAISASTSRRKFITFYYEAVAVDEDIIVDGFYFDSNVAIDKITIHARVAPGTSDLTVDLLKDGAEQSKIGTLTAGSTYERTTLAIPIQYITTYRFGIKIKSIGALGNEGEGLNIIIHYYDRE